jgi:hypothetical protein
MSHIFIGEYEEDRFTYSLLRKPFRRDTLRQEKQNRASFFMKKALRAFIKDIKTTGSGQRRELEERIKLHLLFVDSFFSQSSLHLHNHLPVAAQIIVTTGNILFVRKNQIRHMADRTLPILRRFR